MLLIVLCVSFPEPPMFSGQIDGNVVKHVHFGGFDDDEEDDQDEVQAYLCAI